MVMFHSYVSHYQRVSVVSIVMGGPPLPSLDAMPTSESKDVHRGGRQLLAEIDDVRLRSGLAAMAEIGESIDKKGNIFTGNQPNFPMKIMGFSG